MVLSTLRADGTPTAPFTTYRYVGHIAEESIGLAGDQHPPAGRAEKRCLGGTDPILARRGETEAAVALAEEAVVLAADTDHLNMQGDACKDLAEVLSLARRNGEAASRTREALELYERKGNTVSAERVRAMLEDVATDQPIDYGDLTAS